jgi:hypothetical protein
MTRNQEFASLAWSPRHHLRRNTNASKIAMEAGQLNESEKPSVPELIPGSPVHQHPPVWAQRLLLVIEVAIAVWAGMLMIVLPWTRLWTENPILTGWPTIKFILCQPFLRGMISGVGLVDVWIGFSDALHYRDLR